MKKLLTLILLAFTIIGFSQYDDKSKSDTIYGFNNLESKPEFPDGLDKLYATVNNKFQKSEKFKSKKVYTVFTIEKDGSLSDIKILKGLNKKESEQMVQILQNLPNWIPGKFGDTNVRVHHGLIFELK